MGWHDLAKRLTARFGLGNFPLISKRLYSRLQREANRHGEPVMRIISECAESSICARVNAGAWFRAAVVRRLKENGYLLSGEALGQQVMADEVRRKVLDAIRDCNDEFNDTREKGRFTHGN